MHFPQERYSLNFCLCLLRLVQPLHTHKPIVIKTQKVRVLSAERSQTTLEDRLPLRV